MDKQITELAKRIVERKIAGCKDCDGDGEVIKCVAMSCPKTNKLEQYCKYKGDCLHKSIQSCPTCADLRKLAGELCWHEQKKSYGSYEGLYIVCACGAEFLDYKQPAKIHYKEANPTYTIQSLRKLLERMGEWGDFLMWLFESCEDFKVGALHQEAKFADALTSDNLMAQAVLEYFTDLVKGD